MSVDLLPCKRSSSGIGKPGNEVMGRDFITFDRRGEMPHFAGHASRENG
jgi:hypothetical protein